MQRLSSKRILHIPKELKSIWELLSRSKLSPEAKCFGVRSDPDQPLYWKTYQVVRQEAVAVGSSMITPLPALDSSRDAMLTRAASFLKEKSIFGEKDSVDKVDCCCPLVDLVPKVREEREAMLQRMQSEGPPRHPDSPILNDPMSNLQYQYRLPGARRWRCIGLLTGSKSRHLSLLVLLGAAAFDVTVLLLDSDLSFEDMMKVLDRAKCRTLIGQENLIIDILEKLSTWREQRCLNVLVAYGNVPAQSKQKAAATLGIRVMSWPNFTEISRGSVLTPTSSPSDRLAAVLFSQLACSRNSDQLYGIMISHRNLVCATYDWIEKTDSIYSISQHDHFSHAPMSYPFEIVCCLASIYRGQAVAFTDFGAQETEPIYRSSSNPDHNIWKILKEIKEVKPAYLLCPSRFAATLFREMHLKSLISRKCFHRRQFSWVLKSTIRTISKNPMKTRSRGLVAKLIFDGYKSRVGSHLKTIIVPYGCDPWIVRGLQTIFNVDAISVFCTPETVGAVWMGHAPGLALAPHQYNTQVMVDALFESTNDERFQPLHFTSFTISPGPWILDFNNPPKNTLIDQGDGSYKSDQKTVEIGGLIEVLESNGKPAGTPPLLRSPWISDAKENVTAPLAAQNYTVSARAMAHANKTKVDWEVGLKKDLQRYGKVAPGALE